MKVKESPRKEFLYWSDDGNLFALRYGWFLGAPNNWKHRGKVVAREVRHTCAYERSRPSSFDGGDLLVLNDWTRKNALALDPGRENPPKNPHEKPGQPPPK